MANEFTGTGIRDMSDLLACEAALDVSICGVSLAEESQTRFQDQGAHDPTPTHYFVLDQLFEHFAFRETSHLLDVGCGTGRVLAYFLLKGYPGKATGIELDPDLAQRAMSWTRAHDGLRVLQGDVLDFDLGEFTDFYLFNPFDSNVLRQFIDQVECQVKHPCTLVHMSDNGDNWWYMGRDGWSEVACGEVLSFRNSRGYEVKAYGHPQHYTIWRYEPVWP